MNNFLTVLLRAVFRTQSKVYGGAFAKIVKGFWLLTFFAKKPHHKRYTVLPVKKKTNYLILFYILLHNFIRFYKQTLRYKLAIE